MGEQADAPPAYSGAAYLDLDGTLLDASSEKTLIARLLKRRSIFFPPLAATRWFARFVGGLFIGEAVFDADRNRRYLKGVKWEEVVEIAEEVVEEKLKFRISTTAHERLAWHREQGHRIVIVSATLQPLVDALMKHVDADLGVACTLPLDKEGRVTGSEKGVNIPRRKGKIPYVEDDATEHAISLKNCWGYGNSTADGYFMQLCGHGVAINAPRSLRKMAEKEGWKVEEWRVDL